MIILRYIFCCIAILAAVPMFGAKAKPKAKKPAVNFDLLAEKAETAYMNYDVETLTDVLDEWEEALAPKQAVPERLRELRQRGIALENMLQRVEKIVIVDSINVAADDFFKAYRLSADAGRIGADDAGRTWYTPERANEIYFTAPDSAGHLAIMVAEILDDGSRGAVKPTGIKVDDESDSAFPFMMADGMTLYFASDANTDGSLGGYDIYRTRRNDDGFYEPTNMGMPYNSPGNDYLLAIDEATGLGWWATDRNAEDGRVNIYVFVPNETRVNYDADVEGLSDLAFITDYRTTQPSGFEADKYLSRLKQSAKTAGGSPQFCISVGDGRVITSAEQLPTGASRQLLQQYLAAEKDLEVRRNVLANYRSRFAQGQKNIANDILSLEGEVEKRQAALTGLRNGLIRAIQQ